MKLSRSFILVPVLILFVFSGYASPSHSPVNSEDHPGVIQQSITLDREQLESQLGRKLKFKERIGLWIIKSKIKHAEKKGKSIHIEGYQPITDGFAIASLVIGIVSLLTLNILLGILAIIFAGISLGKIRRFDGLYKGQGLATAGLVCGIVAVTLVLLVVVLALAFYFV
ncbi:MAG TPA: DUF4190 domain-containing protein [Saprospiraceae bacterium]|nr:DUF4190 domain-containing protein [Saprospiraceae bacterium]